MVTYQRALLLSSLRRYQAPWIRHLAYLEQPPRFSSTLVPFLRWCGKTKSLLGGTRVHDHIVKNGLDRDTFLGNLLVYMYGNCGALDEASTLFSKMPQTDPFSWNFIIKAYALCGKCQEVLQLLELMQQQGVLLDKFILISILSACANEPNLKEGKWLHAFISGSKFEVDVAVGTALITMYGKCGELQHARTLFDKMLERDLISSSAMIAAYAQHGQCKNALQLFHQMQWQGLMPDQVNLCEYPRCMFWPWLTG